MDNKMSQFVKNEDSVKSKQKRIIKCPHCDYEASSERELKTHKTRIHTTSTLSNESQFPNKCELSVIEVRSKSEFKRRVRTHSYKEANFQCNECDKVCDSEFEIEVHISKSHSEDFDCVLCGFEAKDLDNLRVHFVTCEIYRCGICENKFTKLSDIKHHVKTEHIRYIQIIEVIHVKRNRTDPDVMDDKAHLAKELFLELLTK